MSDDSEIETKDGKMGAQTDRGALFALLVRLLIGQLVCLAIEVKSVA